MCAQAIWTFLVLTTRPRTGKDAADPPSLIVSGGVLAVLGRTLNARLIGNPRGLVCWLESGGRHGGSVRLFSGGRSSRGGDGGRGRIG